jgi:DNA mismatch endonuclease, patch repair protein
VGNDKSFSGLSRSELMSRIHARGNKNTELAMVKFLKKYKITGWRRHLSLLGTPDFTFSREKVILFIDGCFWHGCPIHKNKIRTNRRYWNQKISSNKRRDRRNSRALREGGWKVLHIWEHDLVNKKETRLVSRIFTALKGL